MKEVIVTTSWDDGHVLDLKLTELLKKYNLKGTLYVSLKNREFPSVKLLNERQLRELSADFEIGAHTVSHPRLSKLDTVTSRLEIINSKRDLEHILNKPVTSFCYPGGDYDHRHVDIVKQAGFVLARTVGRFKFDLEGNMFELPTSVHAYNHWLDAWKIFMFVKYNPIEFFRLYRRWDLLAMKMFDEVLKSGGLFHLWGHSWEIEDNHQWNQLENVFKYISNRQEVSYKTNSELI